MTKVVERKRWSKPSHGRQWDAKDNAKVTKFHRKLYVRLKKAKGWGQASPELLQSMQDLHDYGYSITDIGAMFGLSRERVRQIFEKYELRRHDEWGSSLRIWNDKAGCFMPVTTEQYAEEIRKSKDRFRREKRKERKRKDIAYLYTLKEELGRNPSSRDLLDRGIYIPMATRWGYNPRKGQMGYARAIKRLYRYAGMEKIDRRGQYKIPPENRHCRYTEEQVKELRRRIASGDRFTKTARELGFHLSTAQAIVHYRSWKDRGIPDESVHDQSAGTGRHEHPAGERGNVEPRDERATA